LERYSTVFVSSQLGHLYYGSDEEKKRQRAKMAATEKLYAYSSVESRTRRATFNATKSGKPNLLGDGELVDDVSSGRIKLDRIEKEKPPGPMQSMLPAEQKALASKQRKGRNKLQHEIGGAKDSFDERIHRAVP
jgi:hypothetical protein